MKFFVSWMRPLNNFDKDRIFISLHLILFSGVQKVFNFSIQKSGNLYQMTLNAKHISMLSDFYNKCLGVFYTL